MYSQKVALLFLAIMAMAGCQTNPVKYEVETVVRPRLMVDDRGRPQQYTVDFTVTETRPDGESIVTRPQILTAVGKQARISTEKSYPNQPPESISCTALVEHEKDGSRVNTSVSIIKKGKEVCLIKQSTTLPQ